MSENNQEESNNKEEYPANTGDSRDDKGRFRPGYSGNPDGKTQGAISITAGIKRKLREIPKGEKKSYLEALISKILKKALVDEDMVAIRQIWNYVDGMPKQGFDLGIAEGIDEVKIEITRAKNETENKGDNSSGEKFGRVREGIKDSNK